MKVGIISDSHDNIWNLARVGGLLKALGVEAVIHCGDYCAPFVLVELDAWAVPVHGVFGNVDGDHFMMTRLALTQLKNVTLYGETAGFELGGLRVAVNHDPRLAQALARTGDYDVVCCGHTHVAEHRLHGKCLFVNPGEVMARRGKATFAVLDTDTREVEIHEI